MSPSFINTVFAACNRLLGITHHRKVGTRNARGNAHIERRNAFLGHAFKLATERGTVRCDEDLVNTLGFAEILANQLIRQGDNNGSTCAFERVYGESPRLPSVLTDSPITDDERSLESSDQDGNVRPAAMNNIVEDVPLHATTAGHLGFKENDCVFYRVKNADYDSDSGKPEWYIYVGKIVQVDEANAEYKIHVYSGERRWLPLWERYRRGGGYEFVRRRHCPDNGVPRIISVKIADVVAPCGLTRGGALDEQSKNWLHSTGVAAPD
ncbi:hypothetical protein Pmar_PMAR022190 [Perkinsus marinus ATCC 50983]|uniref:Uncharacterized protein n=1 Tax=Perkinsus marinus (strain ATCC 50983 / TXsc) TaxID=423536 RepID=C5LMI1_PERM5|nr:hypothetical protein Pmar_PMAR022190 [Perkinsus marinus ATCC 50983]EER02061.1 hypothetical protein Pmar_PMAR022190 [Perkinsus marinus ATCC 50983]|eukprot:XP_002769343.1 hypothetical protein Pmar_PMAR022190 [Perkinsus marinus ATCC 50983]